MNKKEEFKTNGLVKLMFSNDALSPLRQLYYNLRDTDFEPGGDIGIKLHDDSVKSDKELKMRWFFAKSEAAIKLFRDVLDGCELSMSRALTDVKSENMRVVQANIIEVRGSYPLGRWHSDMVDDKLFKNHCITMLTPLFTVEDHIGGLETTSTPRDALDYDTNAITHKYHDGEAIAFDGTETIHRTEKYEASNDDIRLLVCWQLADTAEEMHEPLFRIGKRNGDPMFVGKHV
ncbi:hypothetical protein C0W42_11540 [Photobacterium kishitanii]|uniref:hypothetical protein n=1 Tax=Photobacterium kishitanii TaxID=318456 RepID=UPI000D15FB7A|nr:hypothetical protein [Photobacterium kishitanii]PSU88960.1 hypothetical protein C0W42_11540 [Photobacterium kishitanii]